MLTCKFENGTSTSLRHAVVDVLVMRDDHLLLIKRAKTLIEGGKWALVGGYIERDETVRHAAEREIAEETGYTVTGLTLLSIIDAPNRPGEDRQNISFVFLCQALKKVGNADTESTEQRWFALSALPPARDIAFDHWSDIQFYQEYRDKPFPLPHVHNLSHVS